MKYVDDIDAATVRSLLSYDPETGVFRWLSDRKSGAHGSITHAHAGDVAGSIVHGYVIIGIGKTLYRAHRLAWLYMTGEWPSLDIDHIDTCRANNAFANLRLATRTMNAENNRRARKNSSSGLAGVYHVPRSPAKPWKAQIRSDGKQHYLGCFATCEEAHAAFVAAKRQLHKGCTI